MNIAAILLKKIILEADCDTWSRLRKHYLESEYQGVYKVINKHFEDYGEIPSFDSLKLSIRSDALLNKIYAVQLAETVEINNSQLLEYLKNEYTQEEIMEQMSRFLDESIMMESAKENIEHLQDIILHIEDKVDLKDPAEDMQKIELFATQEELDASLALGINSDFDSKIKFMPHEYILIGGRKGAGKSLTSANIAINNYEDNKSSIYFTIEMTARATLQRMCAMATGVSASRLRRRNLSHGEWLTVAKWWAGRFSQGEQAYHDYSKHHDFDKLHSDLAKQTLKEVQLDIVYDPSLSLATIRSELSKKVEKLNPAVVVVDYANQVKRNNYSSGQYDWTEQIEISKALKSLAQEYEVPIVSPYQIDATGEARFAKGLLDSADAAYTLNPWTKADECITFTCVKMRDEDEVSFTSTMDWSSLRMGPESAISPDLKKKETEDTEGEEPAFDL